LILHEGSPAWCGAGILLEVTSGSWVTSAQG
jgi:hypothetical protein